MKINSKDSTTTHSKRHAESTPARTQQTPSSSEDRNIDFDSLLLSHRVDEFVRWIENNPSPDAKFDVELNTKGEPRIRSCRTASEIRLLLKAGGAGLQRRFPSNSFSPRVRLFSKVAFKYDLESLQDADLVNTVDAVIGIATRLTLFTKELCNRATSIEHQGKVRRHTKASLKNFRGACYLVDHLFNKYKRGLRVIRLDLGYKRNKQLCALDRPLTTEEVFAHRAAFIDELPKLIHHDALVGYIWRTEFKPAKGFHHHFLIFLDAGRSRQDVTVARIIGEYFVQEITDHRGQYLNVNAEYLDRQDEPTTYVGLIRPGDAQRIESLKQIGVSYLCKHDYLIRWIMPDGHRAFGRTELKEAKALNR